MNNNKVLPLLLIGVVISCIVECSIADELSCENSWQSSHYQIYATNGEPLRTDVTKTLLEQLKELYAGCMDESTLARKKRVDELLEAYQVSSDKCGLESFMTLKTLIEYNSMYTTNLVPYLRESRIRLFEHCKDKFAEDLRAQVDALSDEYKEHLEEIRRLAAQSLYDQQTTDDSHHKVLGPKGPHFLLPKSALERGILEYIEQREGGIDKSLSKSAIKELIKTNFIRYAGRPCGAVMLGLRDSIAIYDLFRYSSELTAQLDELSNQWMSNVAVCREILQDGSSICWDTIELFLKDRPHRSLATRLKATLKCANC